MNCNKERFVILNDQDSHKYKIPVKLEKEFLFEMDRAYELDDYDEFEKKFGQYRVGDMRNLSLSE